MSTSPDSRPDLQSKSNGWRAQLERVRGTAGWQRAAQVGTSRRTKRIGLGVLMFLVVFGLLGALGGPPLLHHLAETQLSKVLERPVTVGKISINPYTLRLDVDQLHIAERDGKAPFVDVGHLHVNASWSSIFRRAPVIEELRIDAPRVHIVRTAEQRFNFSDIVDRLTAPENPPKPKSTEPARFVFANLQLTNGAIELVDQPLGAQHKVDNLQIGVPFLASLPADVNIFVQPLLAASIDGAPLRFSGQTKPFSDSLESNLNIKLDGLELPRYLGYVPGPLPVAVPQGKLTTDLTIDFQKPKTGAPVLRVHGTAGLDNLEVTDAKKAPLVAAKQVRATLADVRPLDNVFHLDALTLDGVRVDAVRAADGSINFAQLGGKSAPAEAKPAAPEPTAKPKPLDVVVSKLQLANSTVHWRDATTQPAADLTLEDLHGDVAVHTLGGPITFDVGTKLSQGGTLNVKGNTSLEKNNGELELKLDSVKLAGIGPYLRQAGAPQLQNGALSADGKIALDFGDSASDQIAGDLLGSHRGLHGDATAARLIEGASVMPMLAIATASALATPWLLPLLARLASSVLRRPIAEPSVPPSAIFLALAGCTVAWTMYGVAFRLLAAALFGATSGTTASYVAVFTLSYLAGYVFLLSPGGLGAREEVLQRLLAATALHPVPDALLLIVVSRLWLTVLESVPGLLWLVFSRSPSAARTVPPPTS